MFVYIGVVTDLQRVFRFNCSCGLHLKVKLR